MMTKRILYWEDITEGAEIPAITLELSMKRMIMAACGTRDLYPLHYDRDFARALGQKDVIPNVIFLGGMLSRCLTDWTGPSGKIRKLGFVPATPSYLGDTITAGGRVTKKYVDSSDHKVDCGLTVTKQDGSIVVNCHATIVLPSKAN
jgi:acyl dehydratase